MHFANVYCCPSMKKRERSPVRMHMYVEVKGLEQLGEICNVILTAISTCRSHEILVINNNSTTSHTLGHWVVVLQNQRHNTVQQSSSPSSFMENIPTQKLLCTVQDRGRRLPTVLPKFPQPIRHQQQRQRVKRKQVKLCQLPMRMRSLTYMLIIIIKSVISMCVAYC